MWRGTDARAHATLRRHGPASGRMQRGNEGATSASYRLTGDADVTHSRALAKRTNEHMNEPPGAHARACAWGGGGGLVAGAEPIAGGRT